MSHVILSQLREHLFADLLMGDALRFVLRNIGDLRDILILDSGCGTGEYSVFFALQGAKVIGIDKDRSRLDAANARARSAGVEERCMFLEGSSESTGIESESIDLLFSRSTIQYMDRPRALDEYFRVVKPGGSVALIENLPHNPLMNLYRAHRRLTSTTPEKKAYVDSIRGYITPREIEAFGDRFAYSAHREFHLLRMASIYLAITFKTSLWAKRADALMSSIDRGLLGAAPVLGSLAWFTALYCRGKKA